MNGGGRATVLVTGNEGYIGSVLTDRLLELGHRVIGLDTGAFRDVAFLRPRHAPHVQITKDIRDAEAADFAGVDAVVHLAALSNDPLGSLRPQATHAINHHATVRVAEAARKAGVSRFLFSSSCSMYGVQSDGLVDEDAPLHPQTPYAEAKVAAERDLARLADSGFTPVFLRNATVFGISPRLRLDLVVQNLAAWGYTTGTIAILSDGTPWRPLVHVEDVAEAFRVFLEAPRDAVHGRAFNVGHPDNNVQVRDIAAMVREELPECRVDIRNENPADNRSYRVAFDRALALGFRPRRNVADGAREVVAAFRAAPLVRADLDSDAYVTLSRYRRLMAEGVLDDELRLRADLADRR